MLYFAWFLVSSNVYIIHVSTEIHIEKNANKNEHSHCFERVRGNVIFSAGENLSFIIQMYNFMNKVLKSKFND